jgi:hypothetical protein
MSEKIQPIKDTGTAQRRTTKHELVLATWEGLDCESVGARELEQIQRDVAHHFGDGAIESPAALARIVADEGAHLRHPEVLEFDARWRERKLSESTAAKFSFATLADTVESLRALEKLRKELSHKQDVRGLRDLRDAVLKSKQDRALVAASLVLSETERAEAKEIAGWLGVWVRTPELFADWLDLRRSSPEFRKRFGE